MSLSLEIWLVLTCLNMTRFESLHPISVLIFFSGSNHSLIAPSHPLFREVVIVTDSDGNALELDAKIGEMRTLDPAKGLRFGANHTRTESMR